eukprot:TRINITY_DN71003_c0_g1_i1.p1 TRINITY_DN71003_c0_g1~~TRINITY_DN71003_c0_g1_i1.p1  ORF type:complete len:1754 (+),score=488.29 TRINITY_DN71003_c0_g1_i1:100-5262(+)
MAAAEEGGGAPAAGDAPPAPAGAAAPQAAGNDSPPADSPPADAPGAEAAAPAAGGSCRAPPALVLDAQAVAAAAEHAVHDSESRGASGTGDLATAARDTSRLHAGAGNGVEGLAASVCSRALSVEPDSEEVGTSFNEHAQSVFSLGPSDEAGQFSPGSQGSPNERAPLHRDPRMPSALKPSGSLRRGRRKAPRGQAGTEGAVGERRGTAFSLDVQCNSFGTQQLNSPDGVALQPMVSGALGGTATTAPGRKRVSHAEKVLATNFQPPEEAVKEWRYRRESKAVQSESLRRLAAWSSLDCAGTNHNIISREVDQGDTLGLRAGRWAVFAAVGCIVGTMAWMVRRGADLLSNWKLKTVIEAIENGHALTTSFFFGISFLFVAIAVFIGVAVPVVAGSGFEEVKAFINGIDVPGMQSPVVILANVAGAVLSMASGIVVGPDGPVVHAGAAVGGLLSQGTKCGSCQIRSKFLRALRNDRDRHDYTVAGAAAGVAVVFGTPVGGVVFALEEASREWNTDFTWKTLVTTTMATFTLCLLLSGDTTLRDRSMLHLTPTDGPYAGVNYWEFPLVAVLAAAAGACGGLFNVVAMHWGRLGARMRGAVGRYLAGMPPRGWEALPSTIVSFSQARAGMKVHMTPMGCSEREVYVGTVQHKRANYAVVRWHPPDRGGPPESFFMSSSGGRSNETVESREWWDGPARARTDVCSSVDPSLKGWKQYRSLMESAEEVRKKFREHPLLTFDKDVVGFCCGRDGEVIEKRTDGLGRVEVRMDFSKTVSLQQHLPGVEKPRLKFWVPSEATAEPRAPELRRPAAQGPCAPYSPPSRVRLATFVLPEAVFVTLIVCAVRYAFADIFTHCHLHPAGENGSMWLSTNSETESEARLLHWSCNETATAYSDAASLTMEPQNSVLRLLLSEGPAGSGRVFDMEILAAFAAVYFFMAVLCTGLCLPQGTFLPLLVCGAAVGRLWGEVVHELVSSIARPGTYALLGAVAMLTGSVRGMLYLSVLFAEAAGDIQLLPPILVVTLVAKHVAGLVSEPFHESVMEQMDMPFLEPGPPSQMRFFTAGNVMKIPRCFPQRVTLTRLRALLSATSHNAYPVVKHCREVVEIEKRGDDPTRGRHGESLEVEVLDDFDPQTQQNIATLMRVCGGKAERAGLVRFTNQRITRVVCFDASDEPLDMGDRGNVTRSRFRQVVRDIRRAYKVVLEFEGNASPTPLLGMISREALYVLLHPANRRYWRTRDSQVGVTWYREKGCRLVHVSAVEKRPSRVSDEIQLVFRESNRFGETGGSNPFICHPPDCLAQQLKQLFEATGVRMSGFDVGEGALVPVGSMVTLEVGGTTEVGVVSAVNHGERPDCAATYSVELASGARATGVSERRFFRREDPITVQARVRIRDQVSIPGLRHGSVGIVSSLDTASWTCTVDFPCSSLDRVTWKGHVALVEGLDDHCRWRAGDKVQWDDRDHGTVCFERGDRPMPHGDFVKCCDNLRIKAFDDDSWGQKKHGDSANDRDLWVDLLPYIDLGTHIIPPTFPLTRLFNNFRSQGLRHVVVVDTGHNPIGIITRQELCHRFAHFWLDEQVHWRERRRDPLTGEFKTKEQFMEEAADKSEREVEHLWEEAEREEITQRKHRQGSHAQQRATGPLSEQRLRALHLETEEQLVGESYDLPFEGPDPDEDDDLDARQVTSAVRPCAPSPRRQRRVVAATVSPSQPSLGGATESARGLTMMLRE